MAKVPRHQGRAEPKLGPSDSSDTFSDRPDRPATDSDDGGTGERPTVGKVPHAKDEGTDRVVNSEAAAGSLAGLPDEKLKKRRR